MQSKIERASPYFTIAFALLVGGVIVAGCGKSQPKNAGTLTKIDPATAATVTGTVSFEGAVPAAPDVDMSSDAYCGTKASMQPPEVTNEVAVTEGKLANVFVYVSKGLEGKSFEIPSDTVVLDQQGCRYHPHVLGVMVGQQLRVHNSDSTPHNVHGAPKNSSVFNISQPSYDLKANKVFDEAEVMVPVSCDIHGWMKSYIGVLNHPFFGVSGKDGAFTLKNLPPGTYTITAWHEKYGTQQQEITVTAKENKQINFSFKAS